MAEDRRLTISSTGRLYPDEVARRTFATARRGFDPSEVRAFLEQLARDIVAAEQREHELRDLLADAERRAESPVLDEATLTTALGHETARVLRSAHEAAADLVGRAETDANRMLTEAQEEAGRLQARAEQVASERASQSDAAAAEIRRRAQEEASGRLDAARTEADVLMEQARAECRAMLSEAQELRARVLGDLSRRRRVLHSQIEQLRAGRERMAETLSGVRHTVEQITDELFRAEDEARVAAEAAGRQLAAAPASVEAPSTALTAAQVERSLPAAAPPEVIPEFAASADSDSDAAFRIAEGQDAEAASSADRSAKEQTVEELFARLRAEQAQTVLQESAQADTVQIETTQPEGAPAGEDGEEIDAAGVAVTDGSHAGPPPADGNEEAVEEDPLVTRRNEILDPITSMLSRRLKRALSDDQNDILDRLRGSKVRGLQLFAPEKEHRERYAQAAAEQLAEAARAGAAFAGGKADDAPGVEDLASDLAAALVSALRRRLEGRDLEEQGDEAFVVEHVGAAFRDWKGARIERLAADEAVAAFSRGEIAVTDPEASLRWVVDDDGAQCPDCDDNALAGPVPCGEVFPTGHTHPPAHSGCRCLLAPADA